MVTLTLTEKQALVLIVLLEKSDEGVLKAKLLPTLYSQVNK